VSHGTRAQTAASQPRQMEREGPRRAIKRLNRVSLWCSFMTAERSLLIVGFCVDKSSPWQRVSGPVTSSRVHSD